MSRNKYLRFAALAALGAALTQPAWAATAFPASVDENNPSQTSGAGNLEQQRGYAADRSTGATASEASTRAIGKFTVAVPSPVSIDDNKPSGSVR